VMSSYIDQQSISDQHTTHGLSASGAQVQPEHQGCMQMISTTANNVPSCYHKGASYLNAITCMLHSGEDTSTSDNTS